MKEKETYYLTFGDKKTAPISHVFIKNAGTSYNIKITPIGVYYGQTRLEVTMPIRGYIETLANGETIQEAVVFSEKELKPTKIEMVKMPDYPGMLEEANQQLKERDQKIGQLESALATEREARRKSLK